MTLESLAPLALEAHAPASTPGDVDLYSATDLALCSSEEARELIPYESAVTLGVLPLALVHRGRSQRLHCAAREDSDKVRDAARFIAGCDVSLSVASRDLLDEAIMKAYRGSDTLIRRDIERFVREAPPIAKRPAELPKATGDAATFLTTLLEFCVARGASDLHLCPSPHGAFVRLRIDGELLSQEERHYPASLHVHLVSRLKVLAGLDISNHLLPQDGAFSLRIGNSPRSIRISTIPSMHGESVVLRFLYTRKLPKLSHLGFEPATLDRVRSAIARAHGVILLTGPTGSGKTNTAYAVALTLQAQGRNVVTVEDPVEAPIPGAVQVQVREKQGLSYPTALRSVLRHDPDVIVIGEIRDGESARIALNAASTGHLTISSLHVGSALQVFERLRSFEISASESSQAVLLVVNQRLVPKLCDRCKTLDYECPQGLRGRVYREVGCPACDGSGFKGRVLMTELLDLQSYAAKEVCGKATTPREALESLSSGCIIPWTRSLEYHLEQGAITVRQVDEFIESEIAGGDRM